MCVHKIPARKFRENSLEIRTCSGTHFWLYLEFCNKYWELLFLSWSNLFTIPTNGCLFSRYMICVLVIFNIIFQIMFLFWSELVRKLKRPSWFNKKSTSLSAILYCLKIILQLLTTSDIFLISLRRANGHWILHGQFWAQTHFITMDWHVRMDLHLVMS